MIHGGALTDIRKGKVQPSTKPDGAEFRLIKKVYLVAEALFLSSWIAPAKAFPFVTFAPDCIRARPWLFIAAMAVNAIAIIAWIVFRKRNSWIIPTGIAVTALNLSLSTLEYSFIAAQRGLLPDGLFLLPLQAFLFGFYSRNRRITWFLFLVTISLILASIAATGQNLADAEVRAKASVLIIECGGVLLATWVFQRMSLLLARRQQYLKDLAFVDQETGLPNGRTLLDETESQMGQCESQGKLLVLAGVRVSRLDELAERFGYDNTVQWLMRFAGEFESSVDLWSLRETQARSSARLYRVDANILAFTITIPPSLFRLDSAISNGLADCMTETLRALHSDALIDFAGAFAVYPVDARTAQELFTNMQSTLRGLTHRDHSQFTQFDGTAFEAYLRVERVKEQMLSGSFSGEIRSVFQPKVDPATGECRGFEALARWSSPILGDISPGEFIALAETNGAIETVTKKTLEDLAAFIARAREAGREPARIAFNLSPILISRSYIDGLLEWIRANDAADWLEIEITEGMFLNATQSLNEDLARVREAGVNFAIDDFGTGYSNLGYLQSLKASVLKIDKRFVDGIPENATNANLVRAILQMAKSFGMKVVAEGVETAEQRDYLLAQGCDLIQGFFYSKPLEADEALAWLRERS